MEPKNILIALLIVIAVVYHAFWYVTEGRRKHQPGALKPTPLALGIAFVANFFDTLGIGSYATTTSMSKLWNVMPDEKIPGTLNVGYVMATVVQAVIFMTIIEVDFIDARQHHRRRGARRLSRRRRRRPDSPGGRCRSAWASALLVASALMVLSTVRTGAGSGRGARPVGRQAGHRGRHFDGARRADDARHRLLRAVPDHDQPAREWTRACPTRS